MESQYPGNGIYVVHGEISALMTSLRKVHWSSRSYQEDENNPLLKNLAKLKGILNQISDLREIDLITFLSPFLDVIRSNETSVQVTVLALSSMNKFISYGLVGGVAEKYLLPVIDNVADAVAHANFVTTDHPSDTVILMKIVEVLRTLILSPLGLQLSNDSICEIMLSCFKICFETRLNELLRHSAERCLKDIVQLLFSRLPLFTKTADGNTNQYNKMRMRSKSVEMLHEKKKKQNKSSNLKQYVNDKTESAKNDEIDRNTTRQAEWIVDSENNESIDGVQNANSETVLVDEFADSHNLEEQNEEHKIEIGLTDDAQGFIEENDKTDENVDGNCLILSEDTLKKNVDNKCIDDAALPLNSENTEIVESKTPTLDISEENTNDIPNEYKVEPSESATVSESDSASKLNSEANDENSSNKEYVNSQGVRFMSNDPNLEDWLIAERIPLEPHNSICVQELLRFLSLICNPYDKQNTEVMIQMSLSLLTIALEVGASSIVQHPSLLAIIKDTLCRNLLSLLHTERMPIFTTTLHVSFLLFESMRHHLKFQMEYFLTRLSEIIGNTSKSSYDKKEMALESLVQLWRIPGLVTELFLNYDCDLYCPNLYEDITKLLSKNVYPVAGIYNTHLLSLDALLTIVESIEKHCHSRISNDKLTDGQTAAEVTALADKALITDSTRNGAPSHERLMAIKRKKKLLATGVEHFNASAKKGIQFLQERGLLSTPLDPAEVAVFLRENPHLDKKTIGEYISHRSNIVVLEQFVRSFDFTNTRIDEALRLYLEAFRLPGESPLISLVMQQFADHWHKCNNEPFSKSDAAFILAYAIIMLNTDQHNQTVRKQRTPMTVEDFKKNVKGVDGGKDFDQELLDKIYQSIKNEEIVMPAEQTGILKENYLWKISLRRGAGKDGMYIKAKDGLYDHELFSLCWGPVVTALSYVFDKAADSSVYYKSIQGFRKCATISAHYGMSNEFDNLTLSLCKFTMLLNPLENPESFTISFGMNSKARLAARTVFNLVHRYGDVLREGWRPVFDCIFQLFRCKLLPKILVEAEDFLELSGKVSLVREDSASQKATESGILSSLYSYITLATEVSSQRINTEDEEECIEVAKTCIIDCHLENLILESKFLRLESLHELLKVLIQASYNSEGTIIISTKQDEDKAIFFLELLLKVVIQNRDRVSSLWPTVCDHLHVLLMAASSSEQQFLIERCVIGLLRLAIRLMRREEISSSILQSLQMLLFLKWNTLSSVSRQISYGLYELLKTGAANIHSEYDWSIIFTLLEIVGAGAPLPKTAQNVHTNGSTQVSDGKSSDDTNTEGCAEDSGLGNDKQYLSSSDSSLNRLTPQTLSSPSESNLFLNSNSIEESGSYLMANELLPHDPFSLVKCCESLSFLVRDMTHITPFNFEKCVHCIRTFVEATMYTGERKIEKKKSVSSLSRSRSKGKSSTGSKKTKVTNKSNNNPYDADESDPDEYPDSYYQVPMQLLDLMHTLHTRTAHIHKWWAEENFETQVSSLWPIGWCPLLQGIARLCCDPRKQVRMSAITYLQRALLMHDLQTLTANEWESCFNNVLFPLLERLLEPLQNKDHSGVEETRMRAATLLSKVFLHHLSPLQLLPSFISLWLKILDFMDRYMHIDTNSDLLNEAIQECVKNMILVMESAKLFSEDESQASFWNITWERVTKFLPTLKEELHKYHSAVPENDDQPISGDAVQSTNDTQYKEDRASVENKPSQPEFDSNLTDASLIKHSIPLFPHMGQLISTPIGPPCVERVPELDSMQMSSLINDTPNFFSHLPSFGTHYPVSNELQSARSYDSHAEYSAPSTILQRAQSLPENGIVYAAPSASSQFGTGVKLVEPATSSRMVQSDSESTVSYELNRNRATEHPHLTYPTFQSNANFYLPASVANLDSISLPSPNADEFSVQQTEQVESQTFADKINESPQRSLPIYSGFSTLSPEAIQTTEDNARQFFYRD